MNFSWLIMFTQFFIFIPMLALTVLFFYVLLLAVKALKIYIRKNS